jgi:hypothetical protein
VELPDGKEFCDLFDLCSLSLFVLSEITRY